MKSQTARKVAIVHNAYGRMSGEEIAIDNLTNLLEKWGVTVQPLGQYSILIGVVQ